MGREGKEGTKIRLMIESQYFGFDLLLMKRVRDCSVRIGEFVLLDKYGVPKEWLFNSSKLPKHPILKKKRENLYPLSIVKSFAGKIVGLGKLSGLKTMSQLCHTIKQLVTEKDVEFRRKSIEVLLVSGEWLQMTLIQFVQLVSQNKLAQQGFYDSWRMIREIISYSKVEECYIVQNERVNHVVESKVRKMINVVTQAAKGQEDRESPSKELISESKNMEGYKFYDSFLAKKFYSESMELIQTIERNYWCVVQSVRTRFVISRERQPFLVGVEALVVKPSQKLLTMKEFSMIIIGETVKLESYVKCLNQYVAEHPSKQPLNLEEPIYQQKRMRCRGDFCDAQMSSIPHLVQGRNRLPMLGGGSRRISGHLVQTVRRRKQRVVQKLKEQGALIFFEFGQEESSEYEQEDEIGKQVKVCENCFVFYLNVMKYFDLDNFGNLIDKKTAKLRLIERMKETTQEANVETQKKQIKIEEKKPQVGERIKKIQSLRQLGVRKEMTPKQINKGDLEDIRSRRVMTQRKQLRPIESQKQLKMDIQKEKTLIDQKIGFKKDAENRRTLLIKERLQKQSEKTIQKLNKNAIDIRARPKTFNQASQSLILKARAIPSSTLDEFKANFKSYYRNNLPQLIDRYCYSTQWPDNLYEFMSNSPIGLKIQNRIKRRPEMSLKRLSDLTGYPEIVSRSTFIFGTLIVDQKTTIPYCVMSSDMVRNVEGQCCNIVIVGDIFDSFIEYIGLAKQLLEEGDNLRIILFNYCGQSHTIYDQNKQFGTVQFNNLLQKLLYLLGTEKNQMNLINLQKQKIKFIGIGYGAYLLGGFLAANPIYSEVIKGVLLANAFKDIKGSFKESMAALLKYYESSDQLVNDNAFAYYNRAVNGKLGGEELQNKSGLNSIRVNGRAYLLKNMLKWVDGGILENLDYFTDRIWLLYGRNNVLVSKTQMQRFLFGTDLDHKQLKNRKWIEIDGGHDLMGDCYEGMLRIFASFVQE